jgi:hypothetical protein
VISRVGGFSVTDVHVRSFWLAGSLVTSRYTTNRGMCYIVHESCQCVRCDAVQNPANDTGVIKRSQN